jgi:hypothetical protein
LLSTLTVSVEIQLAIRVDPQIRGLKILHFLEPKVLTEEDRRRPAEQFELIHLADYTNVQQSVIKRCRGVTFIPPP